MIHAHLGHGLGNSEGVVDVGFAGEAVLALMGLGAEEIGPVDLADLVVGQITLEITAQIAD